MATASCTVLEQSNKLLLYSHNIEGLGLHAWHSHCQAYLTYFFASVPVHQQESTLSPKELVVQEDWVIKRTSVEKKARITLR
jgi:SRSO17 transposase